MVPRYLGKHYVLENSAIEFFLDEINMVVVVVVRGTLELCIC